MFTKNDLEQLLERGIDTATAEKQINHFIRGFPFIDLAEPAVPRKGIVCLPEEEKQVLARLFDKSTEKYQVTKFVPASGAASRMFKHLFEFREKYSEGEAGEKLLNSDHSFGSVHYFLSHIREVAFFDELSLLLEKEDHDFEVLMNRGDYNVLIDFILTSRGLDYSNLPKGLIRFHQYPSGARTSAEEHIAEAALYAGNRDGIARLHFTISPEHRSRFGNLVGNVIHQYEKRYDLIYEISFSVQKPSTDTIAVDEENRPFRNPGGSILFRPGGHGALLENLKDMPSDLIFIKNIDNIVPDRLKESTVFHKKVLGGYLVSAMETVFRFLEKISKNLCGPEDLEEMESAAVRLLCLDIPREYFSYHQDARKKWWFERLNRPIRVCGMVRNQGEPGGGPFWVRDKQGNLSLQIVESSQVDKSKSVQSEIFRNASHFNPVDLVCSIRDYRGNKFDLSRYVDEETGFISVKSSGGRNLKALELPGLWNGAMAGWITIFVEVPIITFNPVKTVNDLLRKEHLRE